MLIPSIAASLSLRKLHREGHRLLPRRGVARVTFCRSLKFRLRDVGDAQGGDFLPFRQPGGGGGLGARKNYVGTVMVFSFSWPTTFLIANLLQQFPAPPNGAGLEYADYGNGSVHRVRFVLMKLAADKAHGTEYFVNKFINKVQSIFASLPKPLGSRA